MAGSTNPFSNSQGSDVYTKNSGQESPNRYLAGFTPLEAMRAGRVDRAREALMALSAGVYL